MKRHLAVVPIVVAAFALAACNSGNSTGPEPTTGTGSGESPSSSSNTASGTADVKPCSLIKSADLNQNGLTKSNSGTDSGARFCTWKNTTANQGNGYTLTAGVRDNQGIGSISTAGYTVTSLGSIDGHQAKQADGASGGYGCFVSLAVGSSSRVDVDVDSDPSTQCQLAKLYAQLVAPNLPND